MKKDLVDISLTELREFIKNADDLHQLELSKLSLIAVKLRLQFLILKNQFSSFQTFYNFYKENEDYRITVNDNLLAKNNELFRDAEFWDLFILEFKNTPSKIEICLFETGNYFDMISFLICLERYNLLDKFNITVVVFKDLKIIPNLFIFNEKDIEMATINFTAFKSNQNLNDFIIKKANNIYEYKIPDNLNITILAYHTIVESTLKFDAVIARNITLNYNFLFHEQLFNSYLLILKNKGLLFTGNKEGFKWCSQFRALSYSNKSIPIYKMI